MRQSIFIIIACFLLFCCHQAQEPNEPDPPVNPEQPEEPEETEETYETYEMPCGCGDEWIPEETIYDRELPWDFPFDPNSEEWKELQQKEGGELYAALQIPEDILYSLSTEDLAAICMKYFPVLYVPVIKSYEIMLDDLFEQFNGIRELFKREDALKELLRHYWTHINNPDFFYFSDVLISAIELILTRYQSPDDSNKEDYIEIVQNLVCRIEKIEFYPYPAYFDFLSVQANTYSRTKILLKIDDKNIEKIPLGENNLLFRYYCKLDEPTFRSVNELSCQYINQFQFKHYEAPAIAFNRDTTPSIPKTDELRQIW